MEQASANEGLFARLLHLQADLATADSLQDMLNRLQRWARGFGLAGATVRLFAERWKIGAPSDFTHGADAFGVRAVPHSAAGQRTTLPRRPERPRTAAAVAAGQTDWPDWLGGAVDAGRRRRTGHGDLQQPRYATLSAGHGHGDAQSTGAHAAGTAGTLGRTRMTPIAPSLQQPVDAFLRYLKVERQLSPLTQLSYSRQLAALMRGAGDRRHRLDGAGRRPGAHAGGAQQTRRPAVRQRRCGSLRCAVSSTGWSAGVLHSNPAKGIRTPRRRHLPKTSTSMK